MSGANTNPSGPGCTLVLIRHAHTEMAGRFCGLSDPPLSRQGIAQLAGLNQRLQAYPISRIFSSGLRRARQTAGAVACHRGLQVEHFEILHELAFGSWEGLDWEQVMARDPEYAQRWLDHYPSVPAPGGEYFEDFVGRVQYAMTAIAEQVENGCAAVITHAGVIRTFLGSLRRMQGAAPEFVNCDYTSCWEVRCQRDEWYLPDPERTEVSVEVTPKLVQRREQL